VIWRQLLNQARKDAGSWIGDAIAEALKHRREHPAVYALAHAYAATEYRLNAKAARAAGRRLVARWLDLRALFHRQRRRHFERKARATAEANQCAAMMAAKAEQV
jgi:hypothetical protein